MAVKKKSPPRKKRVVKKKAVRKVVKKRAVKRKAPTKRKSNPSPRARKFYAAFTTQTKTGKRFYFTGVASNGGLKFTSDINTTTWYSSATKARTEVTNIINSVIGKTEGRKLMPIGGEEVRPKH